MKKILKVAGIGLGAVVGLALLAVLVLFVMSEVALRERHTAAAERLPAPGPVALADAERQARISGCLSCHGQGLRGKLMFEVPNVARVVAPNLTEVAAKASDQQLAAAIRQGIGHDGRALYVMPSPMYSRLSDEETAALIAWIRRLPRGAGEPGAASFGPFGRFSVATGRFPSAVEGVKRFRAEVPIDVGPATAAGRRLAANNCSECHGPALYGETMPAGEVPPDLTVAAGYNSEQFRTLLRTGETPGGNQLGLMKEVAVNDFRYFTDAEIDAIHAYLVARARKLGT